MSVQTVCLEPNGPRLRAAADTATWMSFSSHQRLRVAALKILTQLRNSCAEILADNWKKPSHTRYWGACVSGPARQKPKATCWCKSLAAKTCTTDKLNILKIYSSISTCQGNQQVTLCSTTAAAEGQAPKWPKPQSHFSGADFVEKLNSHGVIGLHTECDLRGPQPTWLLTASGHASTLWFDYKTAQNSLRNAQIRAAGPCRKEKHQSPNSRSYLSLQDHMHKTSRVQ